MFKKLLSECALFLYFIRNVLYKDKCDSIEGKVVSIGGSKVMLLLPFIIITLFWAVYAMPTFAIGTSSEVKMVTVSEIEYSKMKEVLILQEEQINTLTKQVIDRDLLFEKMNNELIIAEKSFQDKLETLDKRLNDKDIEIASLHSKLTDTGKVNEKLKNEIANNIVSDSGSNTFDSLMEIY